MSNCLVGVQWGNYIHLGEFVPVTETGLPQYPQPPITLSMQCLLTTLQAISVGKNRDIAKTVGLSGWEPAAREVFQPAFDRKADSERACSGQSYCLICSLFLPQCNGNGRICSGGALSHEHAQPLGTPQVLLMLPGYLWGSMLHALAHPSHFGSWDPLLLLPSLEPHSSCLSHHPVHPDFQFWRTCRRLYWAHFYTPLKELWKLKEIDSILSSTEVSVEEWQPVKWCTIEHPGYSLDLSL